MGVAISKEAIVAVTNIARERAKMADKIAGKVALCLIAGNFDEARNLADKARALSARSDSVFETLELLGVSVENPGATQD